MTTRDDPSQRANAIFDALNASDAEDQAKEIATVEEQARRLERLRNQVRTQD